MINVTEIFNYKGIKCSIVEPPIYDESLIFENLDIEFHDDTEMNNDLFHQYANEAIRNYLVNSYADNLQKHIDATAQEKYYQDGFACASYANSTNQDWKNEALAFIAWRDQCWQYSIDVQAQVIGGEIEPPTLEDFINNSPTLTWS